LINQGISSSGKILQVNYAGFLEVVDAPLGMGLPLGGDAGQFIKKLSDDDHDIGWGNEKKELPTGGSASQLLAKKSTDDGDVEWVNAPTGGSSGLPPGGTTGQVLTKTSNADGAASWSTVTATSNVKGPTADPTSTSKRYMPIAIYDSGSSTWTYTWEEVL
jgi:hypothetical protein